MGASPAAHGGRRLWLRWMMRLGVWLLVGAVVNVAVCWVTAVFAAPVTGFAPTAEKYRGAIPPLGRPANFPVRPEVHRGNNLATDSVIVPVESEGVFNPRTLDIVIVCYGLPFRSMAAAKWVKGLPLSFRTDLESPHEDWAWAGLPLPKSVEGFRAFRGPAGEVRRLPLQPLWTGFALNTVLLAGIGLSVTSAIRGTRAIVTPREGWCASCRYELRDLLICPECGVRVGTPVQRVVLVVVSSAVLILMGGAVLNALAAIGAGLWCPVSDSPVAVGKLRHLDFYQLPEPLQRLEIYTEFRGSPIACARGIGVAIATWSESRPVSVVEAGWPWTSFVCVQQDGTPFGWSINGGFEAMGLAKKKTVSVFPSPPITCLPFTPHWPGLVLSTLAWSGIVAVVWLGARTLRSVTRPRAARVSGAPDS